MSKLRNGKGSITVEAAVAMPIFICAVVSIMFIIKMVYAHEVMQHAISGAADEIAAYSYLYHVSGAEDIDKTIDKGLADRSELFESHITDVAEAYNAIRGSKGSIGEAIGSYSEVKQKVEAAAGDVKDAFKDPADAFKDPAEEFKSMLSLVGKEAYRDIKSNVLLVPLTKVFIKKHLRAGNSVDADMRLRGLNVDGGFKGLDFSQSRMFANGEDIEIVVRYRLKIPVPFKIVPDICMIQRAVVRAWLGGGKTGSTEGSSLWKMDPLERGREIQKRQGRNLPDKFPVIAKFGNGKAVSIKSINLQDVTYLKPQNVKSKINGYIKELAAFNGGQCQGKVIHGSEIKSRELVIFVPEVEISPQVQAVLDQCIKNAQDNGINMRIESAYGS